MRKLFKKPTSLKAHLWLYFCTFAVIIMIMLWILQTLFLSAFYNSMKLTELEKTGALIKEQYNVGDEDFYEFWFRHSFDSGVFAQVVYEDGSSLRNAYNIPDSPKTEDENKTEKGENPKPPNSDGAPRRPMPRKQDRGYWNYTEFISEIQASAKGETSRIVEGDERRGSFAVYGTAIGELEGKKVYLFLMSPLERTDTTRKVLQTQLIIASFISIILALAIAYFIARRFSKPVEKINHGAKRLAKGDYSVRFENGSYREIDELSDTLNYATMELSRTEELRRDLISNVSHDLRTPLTIIKSYAELIRDISGSNEEKRTKHTEVIIEEANNLSLLVNDMLDLSKIQSGTLKMEMVSFNLKNLVEATIRRFDYYCENHGFKFVLSTDFDCTVTGDERRMEQAIYNLVANAINYTGEDKTVTISLEDAGDNVRFAVKDTGCGIDASEIDLVWDKYYRSSEKHTREKIGSGIGLSIVKNILKSHEASFGVSSQKDVGSEFWFEMKKDI